jgi:glycosyltransferase involved in cell wall biosynthesis
MSAKVTIGIPIYYGEIYLEETLKSILKQNYNDYKIIITDNNPGGKSMHIAQNYAEKYPNIHYTIHEKNIGALQNWNSTIRLAESKYYICAGGHDLWSENFLSSLVDILDKNPDVTLAYAPSIFMDEKGNSLEIPTSYANTTGLGTLARYNLMFWCGEDALYGLMRMNSIKNTRLQIETIGSGAIWLGELVIQGHFQVCPHAYRYRRINRKETSREDQLERYYKTLFSKERIRVFPVMRMGWGYLTSIGAMQIPINKKIKIFFSICTNFFIRYAHDLFYNDPISLIRRLFKGKL